MDDETIARKLRDAGIVSGSQYDCFLRRKSGEEFPHMARTGPINPLTGKHYDRTALEDWFAFVVEQIRLVHKLEIPIEEDRNVWGVWIDESHMVRLAADNTPKRVSIHGTVTPADVRPPSHFPDAERLKASGKKPR